MNFSFIFQYYSCFIFHLRFYAEVVTSLITIWIFFYFYDSTHSIRALETCSTLLLPCWCISLNRISLWISAICSASFVILWIYNVWLIWYWAKWMSIYMCCWFIYFYTFLVISLACLSGCRFVFICHSLLMIKLWNVQTL